MMWIVYIGIINRLKFRFRDNGDDVMKNERLNLSELSNEELAIQLYNEMIYYTEDLYGLSRIIQKQLPRKMMCRIISKLYRLRIR